MKIKKKFRYDFTGLPCKHCNVILSDKNHSNRSKLTKKLRDKMGIIARNSIDTKFNIVKVVDKIESEYLKYINGIMNDWRTLSKHSNTFYKKFAKNELTSNESDNFNLISLNMLSRFETFSRSINVIEHLSEIVNDVYKSSIHTNEITEMLRERNKRIGKILQENEIEIMS